MYTNIKQAPLEVLERADKEVERMKEVLYTVPVKSFDTPTHSRVFLFCTILYIVE
jgi:hypothetical protein